MENRMSIDLDLERRNFEASGICTKSMFENVMWDQWQFKYVPLVREKKICDNAIKINDRFLGWKAAKATPEGFVLVPKVITDEWMAVYVDPEVSKYCKEFEGLPFAVTEKDLPMIQEDFRRPIKESHSRLMKVIEAQEQIHD